MAGVAAHQLAVDPVLLPLEHSSRAAVVRQPGRERVVGEGPLEQGDRLDRVHPLRQPAQRERTPAARRSCAPRDAPAPRATARRAARSPGRAPRAHRPCPRAVSSRSTSPAAAVRAPRPTGWESWHPVPRRVLRDPRWPARTPRTRSPWTRRGTPARPAAPPRRACPPRTAPAAPAARSPPAAAPAARTPPTRFPAAVLGFSDRANRSITVARPGKVSRRACRVSLSSTGRGGSSAATARGKSGIGSSENRIDGHTTPTYPSFAAGASSGNGAKKWL